MAGAPFYNEKMVRHWADAVLAQYGDMRDQSLEIPVSAERIAEDLFDLAVLWEPIPEPENRTILAGLASTERLMIFNDCRRTLFEQTPFLYNTVIAHEIGHWCLHADREAAARLMLPGFERPFQHVCSRGDTSWEERQAHWFASHLLLPRDLLSSKVLEDITHLSEMYQLRDQCQVTLTVLHIALERMGRAYVDEDGTVHRSKAEYKGQRRLL